MGHAHAKKPAQNDVDEQALRQRNDSFNANVSLNLIVQSRAQGARHVRRLLREQIQHEQEDEDPIADAIDDDRDRRLHERWHVDLLLESVQDGSALEGDAESCEPTLESIN